MIPADFARFMQEVHGHPPFAWQSKVVEDTLRHGTWPSLVDVPTGLGKTSMLDAAVFLLALGTDGSAPAGLGRRRIFLVVDRRIVVDQAFEHGQRVAGALARPASGSVCAEVADRLRSLSSRPVSEPPLEVVRMRGGVTWDAAWLPRPDLPAIVTGTVDQVGSRFLFRGYGVSRGRRPIDAALVGTDSLIMIDEAHLAQVFATSLASAQEHDSGVLELPPTSVVHLSATAAGRPAGWVADFDEEAHLTDEVARQRLEAPKSLTLRKLAQGQKKPSEAAVVAEIAGLAAERADGDGARVLVVCNTVDRARQVHERLLKKGAVPVGTQVLLLIGRSRPLDRERLTDRVTELFSAGRSSSPGSAILVATQTVEVGIDLDATDLVSETASWDALVQRIGRVNRRGVLDQASVVVVEDGEAKAPVYGAAKPETAAFLQERAAGDALDVSPRALRHLPAPAGVFSEPPRAPWLLPAHLDAWARTSPVPSNDPPIDPYLHGVNKVVAPVTVAWRDGLLTDGGVSDAATAGSLLEVAPVRAEECLEVPINAFRAWLAPDKKVPAVSDLDDLFDDVPFGEVEGSKEVLRRTPDGTWEWAEAGRLRPGDIVVVPSEYGGLDDFGWKPTNQDPAGDVGERAALRRGQVILRLDHGLPGRLGLEAPDELFDLVRQWCNAVEPEDRAAAETALVSLVGEWVREAEPSGAWAASDRAALREALARGVTVVKPAAETDPGLAVPVLVGTAPGTDWRSVDESDDAGSSNLANRVTLPQHLEAVADRAGAIAERLGLPQELHRVIVDAARWHDWGKVDERFQTMLFDGNALAAELADVPLAKSGMPPGDRQQHANARRLSKLPRGARHEAWSEVLVAEYLAGLEHPYAGDEELVRHLVASHHGHARPLLPPVDDHGTAKLEASIDGTSVVVDLPRGVRLSDADRFARLNRRYGRWGLALLETVVRCADMTVSSEGS